MTRYFVALQLGLAASLYSGTALADAWVQIEAQPTLTAATQSARVYANTLTNVAGFKLAGRWHAIVLGPYATDQDADLARRNLRAQGLIPRDSYISDGANFRQQFWPVGGLATLAPVETPQANVEAPSQQAVEATPIEQPAEPLPAEETPAEARRSEATLTRAEREELQIALRFAGFYKSTIDGSFGRGTRGSMAAWQADKGYEATGILTTKQRNEVVGTYRDFVASLGLTSVDDDVAGLTIDLPLGLVEFDSYVPPFAKYKAKDDSGVEVLLISQSGDEATLGGLYEIMQTLEIVPLEGPRSRDSNSFTLTGRDADMTSTTEARLQNGAIKGFTLIWPNGDFQRRDMALAAMRKWSATEAVLPDAYGDGAAQDIDLLAGLDIRRADITGSGFYVDAAGSVLTASSVVDQCTQILLDDTYPATVTATQEGMALLTPNGNLSPLAQANFDLRLPRLQSEIMVSGYPYEGRLGAASLSYGMMAEHKGLNGEEGILRLSVATQAGDFGGPVLASSGGVIGMLTPAPNTDRALPEDTGFAYDIEMISGFLSSNGITVSAADSDRDLSDLELVTYGRDVTTLVSCWN
ncbi:putative peptidoglycan binding protein [Pacificibacter maritimus]|uniref:Putative peptidoglycan binding protein n=1 Tax=Pacificibacter maritimus TaxID=762213 RepID=A0A3N4UQY4_9RHOB|nr:serine protease [Pacificibacter maritimus]RPE71055.1 putative peptidoglycan binding protein [Pacificibacter maritimus]